MHLFYRNFVEKGIWIHHGHLLIFDKESYRMEHALMKQTMNTHR